MTPKEAILAWRRYQVINDNYEARALAVFHAALQASIKPLVKHITPGASLEYLLEKVDQVVKRDHIEKALVTVYKMIGTDQAKLTWEGLERQAGKGLKSAGVATGSPSSPTLGVSFRSEAWVRQMQDYALSQAGNKIDPIDRTTKNILRETLAASYAKPQGHRARARELRNELNSPAFTYKRALRIARTESTAASNYGTMTAGRSSTLLLEKYWIPAAQPGRTREAHLAMLGSPAVDLEGKFIVGGEEMDRPGDSDASARNVVNCRCSVALRVKRDKDGRVMRRSAPGTAVSTPKPAPIQAAQQAAQEAVNAVAQVGRYREAKTIQEANEIGLELGLAKTVDYKGLKVDVANEINRVTFEIQRAFPELKETSNFLGSIQERDRRVYEMQVEATAKRYQQVFRDMPWDECIRRAKAKIPRERVKAGVAAQSATYRTQAYAEKFNGISFNAGGNYKGFTVSDYKRVGLEQQSAKWWSIGADTGIEHTIAHELGHELDKLVGMLREDPEFLAIYRASVSQGREYVRTNLSNYAYSGHDPQAEFIAEAFGEYWATKNPRPLAKQIVDLLLTRYRLKFKK